MGKQLTDTSVTVRTAVLAGDLIYGVRPSLGAAGGFAIEVQDFNKSVAELVNLYSYVMAGQMLEPQPGGARILMHTPVLDVLIPSSGNLSCGDAEVPATNNWNCSIKVNGVEIGTMSVLAGAKIPVFNFSGDTILTGGADTLRVHTPSTPDPTLAGFNFAIYGRKVL